MHFKFTSDNGLEGGWGKLLSAPSLSPQHPCRFFSSLFTAPLHCTWTRLRNRPWEGPTQNK